MRSEALQSEKGTPKELAYFIELANEISPYFQLPSIEPEVKALKNKRSVYFLGKSNDDYLNCVYETYARVESYLQDNSFEASDFFDLLTGREGKHNAIYKYNEVQKARENLQTIIYLNRKAIECMYLSDYNITASLTLSGEIYLELNKQGRLVVSEGRFIKAINGVEIWRIRECEMCEYIFWANRRVKFLKEDNEQMRVINQEEQRRYITAASQPLQDIATLMLETGMRPEEMCRIRRENVHLERGYVFNPYGKTKAAKRKIPLNDMAAAILRVRLENDSGSYMFPGRGVGDAPILKVNNAHAGALKRSKVAPFRLYDLRHTWATRAAMAGIDLVTLAAMLGHSRIQMVLRYAHPTEEHQFRAMRKLEAFVGGERVSA